jgi:RNA polymerase-binding transcription factor DksA
MNIDTTHFKQQLLEEKARLEKELQSVGTKNPDAPGDWNITYPDMNVSASAEDEVADQEEKYENSAAMELGLETQLKEVDAALGRIEAGTYGLCEVDKSPIDEERLRANPSARTCIAHADQESL